MIKTDKYEEYIPPVLRVVRMLDGSIKVQERVHTILKGYHWQTRPEFCFSDIRSAFNLVKRLEKKHLDAFLADRVLEVIPRPED